MRKVNRTDVANKNLRYSFHHNHQPMICFTISSSNKILLNFLYILVQLVSKSVCNNMADMDTDMKT